MFSDQFGRIAGKRSLLVPSLLTAVGAVVLPVATIGGAPANAVAATPALISLNSGDATFTSAVTPGS